MKIEQIGAKNAVDIFCGVHCSWYLDKEGRLFGFGLNTTGQLGIGHTDNMSRPTLVYELKGHKIVSVAAGEFHTVILTEAGQVWTTGVNDDGQAGQGDLFGDYTREQKRLAAEKEAQPVPEEIATATPKGKKNKVKEADLESINYFRKPHLVESLANISHVYAAGDFSYAYSARDNQLYSWGFNSFSTLLAGEENVFAPRPCKMRFFGDRQIQDMALGDNHVVVLTSTEEVKEQVRDAPMEVHEAVAETVEIAEVPTDVKEVE